MNVSFAGSSFLRCVSDDKCARITFLLKIHVSKLTAHFASVVLWLAKRDVNSDYGNYI